MTKNKKNLLSDVKIEVCIVCNDPDNGLFNGRLEAIDINNNLGLISAKEPAARIRWIIKDGKYTAISIAGKHFNIFGYKGWVGNWCWDMIIMRGEDVIDLLNWLKKKNWFQTDEGEERLYNRWNSKYIFQQDDIRLIAKNFDA